MTDWGWTLVERRRRGGRPYSSGSRGYADWRQDRAPPVSRGRWGPNPTPNPPVPLLVKSARRQDFRTRSYADAVRGSRPRLSANTQRRAESRRFASRSNSRGDDGIIRRAANPAMAKTVREMHHTIKVQHHLNNLSEENHGSANTMIDNKVKELADSIKPALPRDDILHILMGNAKNWGQVTKQTLQEHYQKVLDELQHRMRRDAYRDWPEALAVAERWAKRNLPRVTNGTLNQARNLIADCYQEATNNQPQRETGTVQVHAEVHGPQTGANAILTRRVDTGPATVRRAFATQTEGTGNQQQQREITGTPVHTNVQAPEVLHILTSHNAPLPISTESRDTQRVTVEPQLQAQSQIQEQPGSSRTVDAGVSTDFNLEQQGREQRTVRFRSSNNPSVVTADMFDDRIHSLPPSPLQDPRAQTSTPDMGVTEQEQEWLARSSASESEGEEEGEDEGQQLEQEDSRLHSPTDEEMIAAVLLEEEDLEEPPRRHRVTRHIQTKRKKRDWSLTVTKPYLIIGDSNLSRISSFDYEDVQIDSYPGATFLNAAQLMNNVRKQVDVRKIVLSFGINSRSRDPKATVIKQLQTAVRETKKKFPEASVYVPLINFSVYLPETDQLNLNELNCHIHRNMSHVSLLNYDFFDTKEDHIHWTAKTAQSILRHWAEQLNFPAPQT